MTNSNRCSPTSRRQAELLIEQRRRRSRTGDGLDLLTWTIVRRRWLKPGVMLDLTRHKFLLDLYNCTARKLVVYKASQLGASEYLISYMLHAADVRQATGLYVFPTERHVSQFAAARFGPALEASSYLESIVVEGRAAGGKRGADQVTLKRIRDRFLYLRGGQVSPEGAAAQLKSIDADVLALDEVDEMDSRAPDIAIKRLGHSVIGEERWVSTPTFAGVGIHAAWGESDQREWHVPCPHCGKWQPLDIHQVVIEWDRLERPQRWHGQDEDRAWAACVRCGRELDRLADGVWVPAWPGREVAGFHLTKLFSPWATLPVIVAALDTANETKRREAMNQDLGEPYTPRGGKLSDEVLDKCRRDYAHGPEGEGAVMGVDVGEVLHAVIRGPADRETGERPQHWAGEVESFAGLILLMRMYRVGTVAIDALPETTKAREFQAAAPGRVWLAYYATQATGLKGVDSAEWDEEKGVVNLDRTRTMDEMYTGFFAGKSTLPAHARDVADYYDHLKAPTRVVEDAANGRKVARYVESGPDHLAHAENYCLVAASAPRPAPAQVQSRAVSQASVQQKFGF